MLMAALVWYDPDGVTKSGFNDVDQNDPARLVAALDRRSSALLYEPYRTAMLGHVTTTSGPIIDVGAGGGHLVDRIATSHEGRLVVGVEPSAALVKAAHSAGGQIVRAAGEALPLAPSSVGCAIAERVLQHVDDVPAVLAEMDRVLGPGGLLLLADPDHRAVRLRVPRLQHLADRLVHWRARAGTASPGAVGLCHSWLSGHGYSVRQETFLCTTSSFAEARTITNFPEWAHLAKEDGEDVSLPDVSAWEDHWRRVADSGANKTAWFHWPVVLTLASRTPV